MGKWKRVLAAVTAGVLCAVSVPLVQKAMPEMVPVVSAAEAGDTGTYGDLTYQVLNDGTVEITDCDEAVTNVEIPAEIDGMAVTSIGGGSVFFVHQFDRNHHSGQCDQHWILCVLWVH